MLIADRHERADDGLRTRDLQLGKLALYQLSYVREWSKFYHAVRCAHRVEAR
jgi:hypothetical protein